MPSNTLRSTHLFGALLLALALPISAQAPDADEPAADAAAQTTPIPEPETAKPAATDPALLDAEVLPRASRALLLDAVRTRLIKRWETDVLNSPK